MFTEKSGKYKPFASLVKESLDKRVSSLLENKDFVTAIELDALAEFQDHPDQLKPEMTPDEMMKLLSIKKCNVNPNTGEPEAECEDDIRISSSEDNHSEMEDEEFSRIYDEVFGDDESEDL